MDFFDVKTLDKGLEIIKNFGLKAQAGICEERVPLFEAVGRVLAEDIVSGVDLPDFDRSAVDGYGVHSADVVGASEAIPSLLTPAGEMTMGGTGQLRLERGEAVYIPTGGPLPEGADGVVMIEYCEKIDDTTLLVKRPIYPGEDVSYKGDDVARGERVMTAGRRLSPYDIGLLAGIGISEVAVMRKLRVGVISTGDELIAASEPYALGKIRDINGNALGAALREYGVEVTGHHLVKDDFEALQAVFGKCLEDSDCVLFSGGSSVGLRDFTQEVIRSFDDSEILVHGLAVKPGKPTIVGRVADKLVFGLPGHPSAALLLYNLVVVPYLDTLNHTTLEPIRVAARLMNRVHGAPGRDAFVMVTLSAPDEEGYLQAAPIHSKSGMITLLSRASGFIRISRDVEGYKEGQVVLVTLLRNTLHPGDDLK
ncbi:MAG: hypothetical protein AVO33_09010 [delta proteobacterium ML8_F1]|nr:MAG: hypothetical protein AVO33_09010 [delta proteobacterium ML8_F1]